MIHEYSLQKKAEEDNKNNKKNFLKYKITKSATLFTVCRPKPFVQSPQTG